MRTAPATFFGSVLVLLSPSLGQARPVADTFKGQIVILKQQPPSRFRSNAAFARFLKRYKIKSVWPPKKGADQWRLRFMAFFKRPHKDVEVKLRFYDVTKGKKFVAADSLYTSKGQRILSSSIVLEKPDFRVKRKYMMYLLTARNVVLASTRFQLEGQAERNSGKVVFSDDEVRAR